MATKAILGINNSRKSMSTKENIIQKEKNHYISSVDDFIELLKPGVMSLVVFTSICGILLAPGEIHPFNAIVSILAICGGAGGAAAINMWYDSDIDAKMARTMQRPIPSGRINGEEVLSFGVVTSILSVFVLLTAANTLAALIMAISILFYVFIYTMLLKRRTPQNIVIGGAAGAFPPIIGWVAVTNHVDVYPIILFLIIFFWTPPHFWSLALFRNSDYKNAGVPMMPVIYGAKRTKIEILIYTLLTIMSSLIIPVLGFAGIVYTISSLILGGIFLYLAVKLFWDGPEQTIARKTFFFSILYLFALFGALVFDNLLSWG